MIPAYLVKWVDRRTGTIQRCTIERTSRPDNADRSIVATAVARREAATWDKARKAVATEVWTSFQRLSVYREWIPDPAPPVDPKDAAKSKKNDVFVVDPELQVLSLDLHQLWENL